MLEAFFEATFKLGLVRLWLIEAFTRLCHLFRVCIYKNYYQCTSSKEKVSNDPHGIFFDMSLVTLISVLPTLEQAD